MSPRADFDHPYRTLFCTACGYQVKFPVFCGNRFCPTCSVRRLLRARRRLKAIIEKVRPSKPYSFKHLTLSVPNYKQLDGSVPHLVRSFRKLRHRHFWASHARGGAYVIEVTGGPGSWHVHLHIIVESKFMSWRKLLSSWKQVSGGSAVYIQEIPAGNIVSYLTTYMTKSYVAPQYHEALSWELRSTRLFQTFGSWHSLKVHVIHPEFVCPKCRSSSLMPDYLLERESRNAIANRSPP